MKFTKFVKYKNITCIIVTSMLRNPLNQPLTSSIKCTTIAHKQYKFLKGKTSNLHQTSSNYKKITKVFSKQDSTIFLLDRLIQKRPSKVHFLEHQIQPCSRNHPHLVQCMTSIIVSCLNSFLLYSIPFPYFKVVALLIYAHTISFMFNNSRF